MLMGTYRYHWRMGIVSATKNRMPPRENGTQGPLLNVTRLFLHAAWQPSNFELICTRFEDRYYMWQLLIMCRKLTILLCITFSSKYPHFAAIAIVLVLMISLLGQFKHRPFKQHMDDTVLQSIHLGDNDLEFMLLLCSCLVIVAVSRS